MHKTTSKNSHYDFYGDLSKIKAAIATATCDAKVKARDMFHQSVDDMRDKSEIVQDTVTKYVAKKPLKSLGISMLIGAVIGFLIHK